MSNDLRGDSSTRRWLGPFWESLTSAIKQEHRDTRRRVLAWALSSFAVGLFSWLARLLTGQSGPLFREPTLLGYGMFAGFTIALFLALTWAILAIFPSAPRARDVTFENGVLSVKSPVPLSGHKEELMAVAQEVSEALSSATESSASLRPDPGASDLLPAAPRRVRIRVEALVLPILGLLFLGVAMPLWFWSSISAGYKVRKLLSIQGRETLGKVTRLEWDEGRDSRGRHTGDSGFHNYWFEYRVGERTLEKRSARMREQDLPAPGSIITVTYLPADPMVARPIARSKIAVRLRAFDWAALSLAAAMMIAGLSFFFRNFLAMRKEYHLASHGVAVVGTVTDFTAGIQLQAGRSSQFVPPNLRYQFRTLEGAEIHGETQRKIAGQRTKGSPLRILYDPVAPGKNIPTDALSYVVT